MIEKTLGGGTKVSIKGISPLLAGRIKEALIQSGDIEPQAPTYTVMTVAGSRETYEYNALSMPLERDRPEPPTEIPPYFGAGFAYILKHADWRTLRGILDAAQKDEGLELYAKELLGWEQEREDRRHWDRYVAEHNAWQERLNQRILRSILMSGIEVMMTPEEEKRSQAAWEAEMLSQGITIPEDEHAYRYDWIATGLVRSGKDIQLLMKFAVGGEDDALGAVVDDMFRGDVEQKAT